MVTTTRVAASGEVAARLNDGGWHADDLGPLASWPQALRQSVDCICVVAMTCSTPFSSTNVLRYQPRSLSLRTPANVISMLVVPEPAPASMTSRSRAKS